MYLDDEGREWMIVVIGKEIETIIIIKKKLKN